MAQEPEQELVAEQYKSSDNLNTRIQLHARFSLSTVPWHRWIFNHIDVPPDGRVLELGCGPGTLWLENQDRVPVGLRLVLSDFSSGMLATARRKLADFPHVVKFEVVDAQAIPFDAGQFDGVMAHHMLYHVPDRAKALAEIRRVLKPEGAFYASTVGETHMQELWEMVEDFAPGTLAATQGVSQGFTLENGAPQLATWFDDVRVYHYEDGLVVTEAEPLIAYVRSSLTMMSHVAFPAARQAAFAEAVRRRIADGGPIQITKASGLFVAV
jgi:ubiquinone/menaquinone biosynthesis C-methylase UbiE